MNNNYDKIASQYDFLSRMVFFKSQVNAQVNQLKYISQNSAVLIVGGGTGWILEELAKIHPSGLQVTYVEISQNMILHSKKRNYKANQVSFICSAIEELDLAKQFDVVITPFLFDNFSEERAKKIFYQLNEKLKDKGYWLLTDFALDKGAGLWWKFLLLKSMYLFFKLLNIVEADHLIHIEPYFLSQAYIKIEDRLYYRGFIKASVFKKNCL